MTDKPETRAVLLERLQRFDARHDQMANELHLRTSERDIARKRAEKNEQTIMMKDMHIEFISKMLHRYQGAIVAMPGGKEIAKAIHEIDAPNLNEGLHNPDDIDRLLRR